MRNITSSNRNDKTKNVAGIWSLLGPVLAILLCVIIFILFRFYKTALNEARQDTSEQMISNSAETVNDAALTLGQIMAAGKSAAGFLYDDGVDYEHWADNINHIKDSNSNIYLVTIVDAEGKGVSSITPDPVNLSGYSYYRESDTAYYKIVGNDGVTNNPALVCVVPIVSEEKVIGYINQYMDIITLSRMLPIEGEDSNNGLVVMDVSGKIVYKRGFSPISADENMFEYITKSKLNMSLDSIMTDVKYNIKHSYVVDTPDKSYMFVSIPMNVGGWTCVHILELEYTDMLVDAKIVDVKKLIKSLVIIYSLAIASIVLIMVANRTRQRQLNKVLENKADTDLLTGLYNKISTEQKIGEILENEKEEQHLLFLFDIDNFKKINDTMGHAFGDQVLKALGDELSMEFRKTDILGRTGGDEFTLLIKGLKTEEILNKECDKLVAFFSQFKVGDYVKYSATASIGAAIYPRDGKDFATLYKAADHALYEAKKQGKNRLVCYNAEFENSRKNPAEKAETETDNKSE